MSYQLLVLDIDGTVTNSDKEVTEKTREAVIRLQRRGVQVVLASGRPPRGIYSVAESLEIGSFGNYVLAFNGGKIIEFNTRKCIFEKQLPSHLPGRLWQDALKHQVGIAAYQDDVIAAGTEPDKYMLLESKITNMPIEYRKDFGSYVRFPVSECLITGEPEDLEILEPVLAHKYFHEAQIFHSEPYYLEVTPKNVDKAYGLKHLLNILGIKREDMVCCGDSYNDITMLQHAGLGIAMNNAPGQVKQVADYVTVNDNDHDGIAEVIEKFF